MHCEYTVDTDAAVTEVCIALHPSKTPETSIRASLIKSQSLRQYTHYLEPVENDEAANVCRGGI